MTRSLFFASASVLALAVASASASAAPHELSLAQMDRITAGTQSETDASGGAIVGNDSSATITSSGSVTLDGGVQANARALNLVNSSESTVANGVNVFDGRVNAGANFGGNTHFNVTQLNQVSQEQRRVASLPTYNRSGATISDSYSEAGTSWGSSSFNKLDQVTDVETFSSIKENTMSGTVDALSTLLGQNVQAGRGLAAAGELDVNFDGGEVKFEAGGGVVIGPVDFKGDIKLTLELPEFAVHIQGAGCAVQNGSCTSDGSFSETVEKLRDNSTYFSIAKTEEFGETWNNSGTTVTRAPFELANAKAEYIVVDDSEIDVDSTYVVALAGGAQADMRGMNVVNAAGSAVANGVNVAQQRSGNLQTGGGPLLNLAQTNIIVHSR